MARLIDFLILIRCIALISSGVVFIVLFVLFQSLFILSFSLLAHLFLFSFFLLVVLVVLVGT